MNHIASLIATNVSIILVFTALIILVIVHERDVKRQKCKNNHPAGRGR